MRIPERAKPLEGGDRIATDGKKPVAVVRLIGAKAARPERVGQVDATVMRKAPAPGAEVAEVLGRARKGRGPTVPPTDAVPGPRALPKGCS